jgi:hypothetical protein
MLPLKTKFSNSKGYFDIFCTTEDLELSFGRSSVNFCEICVPTSDMKIYHLLVISQSLLRISNQHKIINVMDHCDVLKKKKVLLFARVLL